MSSIHIRRFAKGEELALRQVFFETIRRINSRDYSEEQVTAWAPDVYDKTDWVSRIQSINPFIALIDDQIVGYADVQRDGYIDHFYCHWRFQGRGIGKALMGKLLQEASTLTLSRLYSHVSLTAKPFFEKYGFRKMKEQQVEVRGEQLTNFVMEKLL